MPTTDPLFAGYRPLASCHDEVFAADGAPRPEAARAVGLLDALGGQEFRTRMRLAQGAFLRQGVTFAVYADGRGVERVFPVDLIPRTVSASDWTPLERGLKQRVQALNAFLADVYGEQRILRDVVRVSRPRPLEPPLALGRPVLPAVWSQPEQRMIVPYLDHPELPDEQIRELYDYALSFAVRNKYNMLATLLDMNTTIHREFTYAPSATSIHTTPHDVLHGRRGVCQDFTNLLIALTRLVGIPARYRVGYIFTGGDYANKEQSEASHAWVECYLPWLGWRGFDPTNGVTTGLDHVRVACGRGADSATPTSGSYRGGGRETLAVTVRVEELLAGAPAG